jgi:hypothetical protein
LSLRVFGLDGTDGNEFCVLRAFRPEELAGD